MSNKDTMLDERAEVAIARLKELQVPGDSEAAHSQADGVLCDLLRDLNFDDVVDEWLKVEKWYA